MKTSVSFNSTIDEIVDLVMRAQRQSPAYVRLHWSVGTLAAALVGFAVFRSALANVSLRAAVSVVAAGIGMAAYHVASQTINRWYAKQSVRRRLGGADALHSEVELQESGILFREKSMDLLIRWPQIERAEVTEAGVELWSKNGILGLVRSRGFTTEAEQREFADEVNRRAAHQPVP